VLDAVTGGHDRVGLRVPRPAERARAVALRLAAGLQHPRPTASARVSPTTAQDVRDDLGTDVDVVLDGGPCRVGVESTIVDCTGSQPRAVAPRRRAPRGHRSAARLGHCDPGERRDASTRHAVVALCAGGDGRRRGAIGDRCARRRRCLRQESEWRCLRSRHRKDFLQDLWCSSHRLT